MAIELEDLGLTPEMAEVMTRLATVGAQVARIISRNGVETDLAAGVGTNAGGDGQKALDVIADDLFREALSETAVAWYASEEQDEVVSLGEGSLGLAIDPLDGSSNIDVNVSIGTIFSIFPAKEDGDATFLRQGHEQLAGGYIIYGPQCALVCTFGDGVKHWVLDLDTNSFRRVADIKPLPQDTTEYAINASNYRHWPAPIRAFIDDLVAGAEGPRGKNFNMRWIASLVAETHRILMRGGVFLYPGDDRKGYERGRLRHVYECAPIAFLITQAGGGATDGCEEVLTALPDRLHARTPFVFGCGAKVARVAAYHDLPGEETSALFNTRGLFRS
ncbi:D-fructose 1,6-bisphosphatase [Rhodobacter aestuarii]|uniref:Fructose-1,6-bisphosphatase class 1 n=1 Tax=Rhodobacter aestuarii TaxID=453582 RepID=A0A1N7JCA2_9RHOB|nr:class 1 fructose-bisphosphatase [Rhodobacter aestuarii]PTV96941.1 D-fructose 1,6-bisphosphatase [Rhodobacter aestuarii]SIS46958.1 D-fructose 1,6-bisphosphatase [Rhodobacter aestuarii]